VLCTRDGKAIRFKEANVRSMGRTAGGVRGVNLRKGDEVVGMSVIDPTAALLTVCEHGYGKRTKFEEYRIQSRGGMGIINIRTSGRNGKVVAVKSVRDNDELVLITEGGMVVRIGVSDMRSIGRATQGVRVINLKSKDRVVALAKVVTDGADSDEDAPNQTENT
ncbi:MAG: DNA gyrase subunit A, partial [Phycisphaerae bacterium]|nr:DNA gyrase subunit A [Phycisphaerae bacterium]